MTRYCSHCQIRLARMYLDGPVTRTGKKRYTRVCWNKNCPLFKQIIKKKTNARA